MFKFLSSGIEFNNLAQSMNGMNVMLEDLIPKIGRSFYKSEYAEDILMLAYIARKGVLNRIEKYDWAVDAKIVVPTIDRGRITLAHAMVQTVGKVSILGDELGISNLVQEIMDGGDAYYEFEKKLPSEIRNAI